MLVNNSLYVGSSDGVHCFDASHGSVIWNFTAADFAHSSATVPTYANGIIYVGWNGPMFFSPVTEHNFYALDASNGHELWNSTLGYKVTTQCAVVNGTVYVPGTFVTSKSPDYQNSCAVVALKSDASPSSTGSGTFESPLPIAVTVAIIVLVVLLISVLIFARRRTMKPTSG